MVVSGAIGSTILETFSGMGLLRQQKVDAMMKIIAMVIMPEKNKAAIVLLLVLFVGQEADDEGAEDCCCCCVWMDVDVDADDCSGRQTSAFVF